MERIAMRHVLGRIERQVALNRIETPIDDDDEVEDGAFSAGMVAAWTAAGDGVRALLGDTDNEPIDDLSKFLDELYGDE